MYIYVCVCSPWCIPMISPLMVGLLPSISQFVENWLALAWPAASSQAGTKFRSSGSTTWSKCRSRWSVQFFWKVGFSYPIMDTWTNINMYSYVYMQLYAHENIISIVAQNIGHASNCRCVIYIYIGVCVCVDTMIYVYYINIHYI